mgnify:CR=1 FL=1
MLQNVKAQPDLLPKIGTLLVCIKPHPDGFYTKGKIYKVVSYRKHSYQGGWQYAGVRLRDDKRQRKDFNFIPISRNYIWKYFRLIERGAAHGGVSKG